MLKGQHHSESSKRKMHISHAGVPLKEEHRRNIGRSLKGKHGWKLPEEHIEKLRISHLGISPSNKGKKGLQKPWNKGLKGIFTHTEEQKKKTSERMMGHPGYMLGKKQSYVARTKLTESLMGGFWYGKIIYHDGPIYCDLWNENLRLRVRAWYGNCCVECGQMWYPGQRKFHVHHVWYNKKACCDDTPRSLILLCDACHNKTTPIKNREYWSKHFQEMIDTYYCGRCWLTKEEMKCLIF